mgnify:CR=1 FL=1
MIKEKLLILALFSIVLFHGFVGISFIIASVMSIFVLPWYLAVAITSLCVRVLFDHNECPLTTLENVIRKKLKVIMPSHGFVHDYVLNFPRTSKQLTVVLRLLLRGK